MKIKDVQKFNLAQKVSHHAHDRMSKSAWETAMMILRKAYGL